MKKFQLTSSISKIVEAVTKNGGKIYIVGGAIRDSLLDKSPKDLDLATDLLPETVRKIVDDLGEFIIPDNSAFKHGINRILEEDTGNIIDLATLRKDDRCDGRHAEVTFTKNVEEDLARRDFTMNAMACTIDSDGTAGELIDLYKGQQHIEEGTIHSVGSPMERFKEDYLRMLRACRFTALGFSLSGWDAACIRDIFAKEILTVSKERIRDEYIKAMSYSHASEFFRSMQSIGILKYIMPDMEQGVDCIQNIYHGDTVFEHNLLTLDAACNLNPDPIFRLAAVTHDIAKPHTKEECEGVGCTFHKHDVMGASLMHNWMREYRFSREQTEYVSKLVRHHLWRFEENSKDKTIRKWLQEVGKDTWRDLITLRICDRKGNVKKADLPSITQPMQRLIDRVEEMLAKGTPLFKEDLKLDGKDLIQLGIKPGPIFKEIFSNALGIVISEPSKNTKAWLKNFVEKNYLGK